jgi:hypothetical protein
VSHARHGGQVDINPVFTLQAGRSIDASLSCRNLVFHFFPRGFTPSDPHPRDAESSVANPAHRHQDLASIPTELLESGDEAAGFGSQSLRIAILAGIDYRTVGPVDKVHNRIPELRELRMQVNCGPTRQEGG